MLKFLKTVLKIAVTAFLVRVIYTLTFSHRQIS